MTNLPACVIIITERERNTSPKERKNEKCVLLSTLSGTRKPMSASTPIAVATSARSSSAHRRTPTTLASPISGEASKGKAEKSAFYFF